jgi:two-component SAPR family response regulator
LEGGRTLADVIKYENDGVKPVSIVTLGDFDIRAGQYSLLENRGCSGKIFDLLKYFITFKGRKLLPDTIIDNLWSESDLIDPKNVLRTQIFRLRKMLREIEHDFQSNDIKCFNLSFSGGYYTFKLGESCVLDVDEFESNIKNAESIRDDKPYEAIDVYRNAVSMYRGEYLSENVQNEWVFPTRNKYHRLYIQSILRLIELLKSDERHSEIPEIYEEAVLVEPYEEALHIYFLEALMHMGEIRNVLSHCNYITSRLYKDMGVKPSSAMRNIYRKLQAETEEYGETDINNIGEKLFDIDNTQGALFCDIDYFKVIYNMERRKGLRSGNKGFLGLITIFAVESKLSAEERQSVMSRLKDVVIQCLRKGDACTVLNKTQMLLILSDAKEESLELIGKRLEKRFNESDDGKRVNIRIKFQPITADQQFILN